MKRFAAFAALVLFACKPVGGPIADADSGPIVEAGVQVVTGVCSLLEGVDSTGTVASICATVEEIAAAVAFILTLRSDRDAGVPAACQYLPGTTLCATATERVKAVRFIAAKRAAILTIDGGTP